MNSTTITITISNLSYPNPDPSLTRKGSNGSNTNLVGITRPMSPALSTGTRSRPVTHPTREEIETKEIEEAMQ